MTVGRKITLTCSLFIVTDQIIHNHKAGTVYYYYYYYLLLIFHTAFKECLRCFRPKSIKPEFLFHSFAMTSFALVSCWFPHVRKQTILLPAHNCALGWKEKEQLPVSSYLSCGRAGDCCTGAYRCAAHDDYSTTWNTQTAHQTSPVMWPLTR
jgi:hypothetical protein